MQESKKNNPGKSIGYQNQNAWKKYTEKNNLSEVYDFSNLYKDFMNQARTEREIIEWTVKTAKDDGFEYYTGQELQPGKRLIIEKGGKNLLLITIGQDQLKEGVNLIGAHIDSPRLDLKPLPMIEDGETVLLKTHYYGGIKKYQWVNIPLALHGVVIDKNGRKIEINIGEKEEDPVFTINDLLPHLAQKIQGEKNFLKGIEGESLRVVVGNIPVEDNDIKEKVKENILIILKEQYNIEEEDLLSSELQFVPAFKARDVGFDKSMIGAYGHDDRVCSFAAVQAMISQKDIPQRTGAVYLMDKEEIGSFGNTSARAVFLYHEMSRLFYQKFPESNESEVRQMMINSFAISADVGAAFNPMYKEVFDKENASKLGFGLILEKYTGARGKYGASDASAEYFGAVRKLYNDHGIQWQSNTLGKIDEGGGGTVSYHLANLGMEVIDSGVPVDGMHAPFETISKVDLYEVFQGYRIFFREMKAC